MAADAATAPRDPGFATRRTVVNRGESMKYVYIALIVVFTAIVLLFKVQNFNTATISLFNMSLTLPMWLLAAGIYVLGMFTGAALVSLLKGWYAGATRRD